MTDYTGDVEPGGPTHVRTLEHLVIRPIDCRQYRASSGIGRVADQPGAEHAGAKADGECASGGGGQQMAARHCGDGGTEQAFSPDLALFFTGAGRSSDHQRDDNAVLAKKCQQKLSVELEI